MRKLAIVCGAFSLAALLSQYLLPSALLFPLALALALAGIGLIPLRRRWLLAPILVLCAMAAGFYAFGMHSMLTLDIAHQLDGTELTTEGRVLTAPLSRESYQKAEITLSVGGRSLNAQLCDFDGGLKELRPGDRIEGRFSLKSADRRNGERYDGDPARGIYLTAYIESPLRVTRGRMGLRGFASLVNAAITDRIRRVFPADTCAFFEALLLGDKSDLYQDDAAHLSLSRAGLMHIVAVSGMHVAFLVGMLRQLMGNTRRASILSILLIWSFVLITGSPPSAVRAGVMQTVALLAPVFGREDDPPTSLLFALALILAANPFAVGSVSLQLSFASLAGILLFSDRFARAVLDALPKRMPRRLRSYLASSTANSLGVLIFTTPLIALHFGTVAVLSPLSNLLTLWAVPLCFGFGYLACLLSPLSMAAAGLIASAVSWPSRFILLAAGLISRPGFACLYLDLGVNWLWLALVYLLFIGAALLFRPGWRRWFYPGCLALFSLFALLTATRLYYGGSGWMTAVDVGQGQSIVAFAGEDTVVIDCGNINSTDDAGDRTGSYLCSRCREDIDVLLLTHLHADHADGVLRLMEYLPVREILIGPDMEDPNGLLPDIMESARKHGTTVRVVERDERLRCGSVSLRLFPPGEKGRINERCVSAVVSIGDADLLVTGDLDRTAERELLRSHPLDGMEYFVVGHHGSKYSNSEELLRGSGARIALISCGYNTFGHPSPETLARLKRTGYSVYRTDEDGTLEFRVA